jgi:hypothetical protein
MTPPRRPRALSLVGDGDDYALWDAAYMLGSLSGAERREFEAHLSTCPPCRESVGELGGVPALLAQLDRDDVVAMDNGQPAATPPLNPLLLTSLLAKVSRRRRSRLMTWTVGAAAAAVLLIGGLVAVHANPVVSNPTPQAGLSALTMTAVAPSPLDSTVMIGSHDWGTHIEMNCTYGERQAASDHHDIEPGDKLAMVVIGRDGSQSQLATWVALTGVTAVPGGSTSMLIGQIAAVQIVSADRGDVLLQRSL